MKVQSELQPKLEQLWQKAIRKNILAKRLLKRIEKELIKPNTDLERVLRWQKKSSKFLTKTVKLVDKTNENDLTL